MKAATSRCIAALNGICVDNDGTLDPCCRYRRSSTAQPIKFTEFTEYQNTVQRSMYQDAANNVHHTGCNKCYIEEDAGWTTLRNNFDTWYSRDASEHIDDSNPLYHVQLRLGNVCNLKCIMCSPKASSSISLERSQHFDKFNAINMAYNVKTSFYWETPEFMEFIKKLSKDVRRIHFGGGEPFIIPEVINVLDQLLLSENNIEISFITNLTKVSDKLIDRLKKFKNLRIAISLEGTDAMNDYLRYPSIWSELVDNLNKIKLNLPNVKLLVNHTLQHSSIYALPNLSKFCLDNNLPLQMNSVVGNDRLTIHSVPPQDMAEFKEWLNNANAQIDPNLRKQLIGFIEYYCYNQNLHKEYYDYVMVLDEIRGTNYYDVFDKETKYIDNLIK